MKKKIKVIIALLCVFVLALAPACTLGTSNTQTGSKENKNDAITSSTETSDKETPDDKTADEETSGDKTTDEETTGGETTGGETTGGETTGGETTGGETTGGETTGGETTGGETTGGETTGGETTGGETTGGETTGGETTGGETTGGETTGGETTGGETTGGETTGGETTGGETTGGETTGGETTGGETTGGETTGGETTGGETTGGETTGGETTGGETTGEKTINIEISGQYVYFGSYPQREVVSQASDSGVYGKDWATENDYIIDADLYSTLTSLAEDQWNAYGDATVGDNKYRRIKQSDATGSASDDINYYNWASSDTYHYFKYEPIKWRILERDGNDVFVMSEIALDDQKYNTKITNITWETGTIRSWLNGYDSSKNLYETDYSNNNFIDTAFTAEEQSIISTTTLENNDNSKSGTEGGNNTDDKIYLLSEDEVYGDSASGYGFASDYDTHDTARQSKSSTYAKAMGAYVECESDDLGNSWWWLRSPGSYTGLYILVRCNGSVYRGGQHADSKSRVVRPAMHINLESLAEN